MNTNIEQLAHEMAQILIENGFFSRLCANCKAGNGTKQPHDSGVDTLSFSLRGDCHSLVKDVSEEWGIDERIIYGKLKKIQGISQPMASDKQLSERVDILRDWLENGVA